VPSLFDIMRVTLGQQTTRFFLDDGVMLATQLLQLWPVQHDDMSPTLFDRTKLLQLTSGLGDAFATYAKHVGDRLLRHGQLIVRQIVQ